MDPGLRRDDVLKLTMDGGAALSTTCFETVVPAQAGTQFCSTAKEKQDSRPKAAVPDQAEQEAYFAPVPPRFFLKKASISP